MKTVYKRGVGKKLKTLLFGKDIRVTSGDVYSAVRDYDFSSYYPESDYVLPAEVPSENVFDIRDFGAVLNDENADNAPAINAAIDAASSAKGIVLVSGGGFTATTVFLKSNVTLFIEHGSAICADKRGRDIRIKQ